MCSISSFALLADVFIVITSSGLRAKIYVIIVRIKKYKLTIKKKKRINKKKHD